MADYAILRDAHAAQMMGAMPERFARLHWSREQIRAEREARLRELVAHARAHSSWHRERLTEVDPVRMTETDLQRVPVMTKHDLMAHFDAIVTDPRLTRSAVECHLDGLIGDAYLFDEYHACASGGSSGMRGVFVYDPDAWSTVFLSYFRFLGQRMQEVLGGAASRVAMVAADKASHMTAALSETFRRPDSGFFRVAATLPLARIVAELNDLQPTILQGYTSMVHQLTHEAEAGRLRIAPRLVATTSEPLLPEIRAAVGRNWNAPLFNGFGSTEGLMGGSCSAERGLHLSDDLFVIEPVDAAGAPVATGTRAAKVLLTRLYDFVQPLIRYELTDEVTVLDEPCPCGSTLLRIDDVQGRLDDCFTYAAGPTVHPFTFRSILGREAAIVEYQVRQTAHGAAVRVRAEDPLDSARVAAKLRDALAIHGLRHAEVTVTVVAALERQATGKLRRFIPL